MSRLFRTKTFWTALGAIAVAIGGWVAGELDFAQFFTAVFAAVQAITWRDAFAKGGRVEN